MVIFLIGVLALVLAAALIRRRGAGTWPRRAGWGVALLGAGLIAWSASWDYESQKFLGRLIMPLGLIWAGLLIAVLGSWKSLRPWVRCVFLLVWIAYTLGGNVWFGAWLMGTLERAYPLVDPAKVKPLDAVCVLGGGTTHRTDGRPAFNSACDRLIMGVQLYRHGRSPLLIGSTPAAETRQLWIDMGVPPDAIMSLPDPVNTSQEIAACKALQEKFGWKRFGLVTSAWHLPRAMALCQKQGMTMIPLPADFRSAQPPGFLLNLVPNENGFMLVQEACWEYVGRLLGR